MSLSPFLKSSSMLSMFVPAFRRWELHHAVNVYKHNGAGLASTRHIQSDDGIVDSSILHRHLPDPDKNHSTSQVCTKFQIYTSYSMHKKHLKRR